MPLLHAGVLSALSPRCSSCPKQSKNNSPKTHSQVLRRKQELLDPNCCPWETTVERAGSGGTQRMREKEFLLAGSAFQGDWKRFSTKATSAKSTWGKVDLSKNLSIPLPQHVARLRTCGIGKTTLQNKTKPSYKRCLK